jgi:hypothetical protein
MQVVGRRQVSRRHGLGDGLAVPGLARVGRRAAALGNGLAGGSGREDP